MRTGFLSSLSRSRVFLSFALCSLGVLVLPATSAQAQATRIFVASTGNDLNDGSRGSPKRNFQAAHDAVATGGDVVALDTAGYGALTITKSVVVTAPAGITGFVTVTSGTAITVNASGATVVLRGLTITSPGTASVGINITDVSALEVNNCNISGFSSKGISFAPASVGTMLVKDTTVRGCFNGILVPTGAPANTKVVLDGCRLESNDNVGFNITPSGTAGVSHRAEARNCVFTDGAGGIVLDGANNRIVVKDCTFSANFLGIQVSTAGATANVDGCTIAGNTNGLTKVGGANLLSRGNNTVEDNDTNGAFTGTYSAK